MLFVVVTFVFSASARLKRPYPLKSCAQGVQKRAKRLFLFQPQAFLQLHYEVLTTGPSSE
jgi:hypothetical protein